MTGERRVRRRDFSRLRVGTPQPEAFVGSITRVTMAVQIPDTSPLPDDPLLLQAMVHELLATLHATQRRAEQLEQRLDQLLRRLYGPRSERANPDQPLLFAEEPKEERDASLPPGLPTCVTGSN